MSNPASFVTAASIDSGNAFVGNQTVTGTFGVTGAQTHVGAVGITGALSVTGVATMGDVGVGSEPEVSAALSVASTTKGLLFPRMTEVQRDAIVTPAEGLMVYNLTTHKLNLRVAAAWEVITSA